MSATASHYDQPRGQPGNAGQFASTNHREAGIDVLDDADLEDAPIIGTPSEFAMRKREMALQGQRELAEQATESEGIAGEEFEVSDTYTSKAEDQGILGRWWSGRKASAAEDRGAEAARFAQQAQEAADIKSREAEQMTAGIESEREVASACASARSTNVVVHGIDLGVGIGDVDVVTEGSYGVMFVESKAGGGDLRDIGGGKVKAGSRTIPGEPLAQVRAQAQAVADEGVAVVPVVCVPNSDTPASWSDESGAWLVGSGKMAEFLDSMDSDPTAVNDVIDATDRHLYNVQVERNEWSNNAASKSDEFSEWSNNAAASHDEAQAKIDEWESNGWAKSSNGADAVASKREWQNKLSGQVRRYAQASRELNVKAEDYAKSARETGEARDANAELAAQVANSRR